MLRSGGQPAIRETLFGDLPISTWSALAGSDPTVPWSLFNQARESIGIGDIQQAVDQLLGVLDTPGLESRHYLQAWHFLRQLGVLPPESMRTEIYGVVVEVALEEGLDILAGYADLSARYINFSNAAILWERPNTALDSKVEDLLGAGRRIIGMIGAWDGERPGPPPSGDARINLLTPIGLHFGQAPYVTLARDELGSPVLDAALRLMQGLIEQARQPPG